MSNHIALRTIKISAEPCCVKLKKFVPVAFLYFTSGEDEEAFAVGITVVVSNF